MPSSYSSDLKLELMTTGEKSGTWGTITNTNLQQLEQAASGYIAIDVTSADVALSLANGAAAKDVAPKNIMHLSLLKLESRLDLHLEPLHPIF